MKSSDNPLNYLMFGQTLSEGKMERLKTHIINFSLKFRNCHVIEERMEAMSMIAFGPLSFYYFRYPLFRALPDLTNKVNSFDDLNKIRIFLNRLQILFNFSRTTYLEIIEPDLR